MLRELLRVTILVPMGGLLTQKNGRMGGQAGRVISMLRNLLPPVLPFYLGQPFRPYHRTWR